MKEVSELIRGEMSAIQSIDVILDKIKDERDRDTLRGMRDNHRRAVDSLKSFADKDYREETVTEAGPWGTFAKTFTSGASFFGDAAAIKALKMGEEHGVKEYRRLLENKDLRREVRELIETDLLPRQEKHLTAIDKYLH